MLDDVAKAPVAQGPVLAPDGPAPFEVVNGQGKARALLICDHASRALPGAYDGLGLGETQLRRHVAWDIGAADITRRLAAKLDAPAVLAGYSRLLIDCNRALDDPTSIVVISDGTVIVGNRGVGAGEAARRARVAYWPYHGAIARALAGFAARGVVPALISMHSFTPILAGIERPWHVGVLWDRDPRLPAPLLEALGAEHGLEVGDNLPYSGRLNFGYSITAHGAAAGLPHALIEIRQDLIDTHHGAAQWAERMARVLAPILGAPATFAAAPATFAAAPATFAAAPD